LSEQLSPTTASLLLGMHENWVVQLAVVQGDWPEGHWQVGQHVEPEPHCHGASLQGVAPADEELHPGAPSPAMATKAPTTLVTRSSQPLLLMKTAAA
jgi:hypothetical protein